MDPPAATIKRAPNRFVAAVRACRPQQWVKNTLVFVPMLAGHAFTFDALMMSTITFVCFCAAASSVYLLNDLVDVEHDRQHPTKRHRPFASGAVSPRTGIMLSFVLGGSAILLATFATPTSVAFILIGYLLLTALYSHVLKRHPILDVWALAAFYGMRVIAGGMATGIMVSEWLMMFSMFAFISLAFVKRYAELHGLEGEPSTQPPGRGYQLADTGLIVNFGTAASYGAVLVLALYINSPAMQRLYGEPWALWILCAIVLYWFSRLWLLARRGEVPDDPLVFAVRDRTSLVCLLASLAVLVLAKFS